MTEKTSREKIIRKAKFVRRMLEFTNRLGSVRPAGVGKEVFIDTAYGKVRTLWYGFDAAEKSAVVFDMHGGGFIMMHADVDERMCVQFNQAAGCKVVSIDYAKAPEHPYPAAVNQVYAVIKHIHDYADEFNIDMEKIAVCGHSAGANLAAVACLQAKVKGDFQIACQILDYPSLDMATSAHDKPYPKGAIPKWLAEFFNACYFDPKDAKDPYVSPVYALPEELKGLPPALFIFAGGDSLHDEGMRYYNMLKSAGVTVKFNDYPHANHGFTYNSSPDSIDARLRMVEFLKGYVG